MTNLEIQCLKDNIGKLVEIETVDGESLLAKVLFVTHSEEWEEHEVLYELVSSNLIDSSRRVESAGGFVLDFDKIASVKPVLNGV